MNDRNPDPTAARPEPARRDFVKTTSAAGLGLLILKPDAEGFNLYALLPLASLPLVPALWKTVSTRTDVPSLNEALAGTGRLLAVFSLLLSAVILLS